MCYKLQSGEKVGMGEIFLFLFLFHDIPCKYYNNNYYLSYSYGANLCNQTYPSPRRRLSLADAPKPDRSITAATAAAAAVPVSYFSHMRKYR